MAKKKQQSFVSNSFQWKPGSRYASKFPIETIEPEIHAIYEENGCLTAAAILERAKSKDSALHPMFEWADKTAANKFRLMEASTIVRSLAPVEVKIVRGKPVSSPARAFELDYTKKPGERAYLKVEDIMEDPDKRSALLQRALGELVSFQRRYRALQELSIVIRSIDEALESIAP